MKPKISFVLMMAVLIFAAGCKKENAPAIDPSQLTGKNWQQMTDDVMPPVDYDNNGIFETNVYILYGACRQDNTFNFSANGVLTRDEGYRKCVWNDPQVITGSWSWNTDQTKLTMTLGGSSRTFSVLSLNYDVLKVQRPDTINSYPTVSTQIFGIL